MSGDRATVIRRIAAASALAIIYASLSYLFLNAALPERGMVSLAFLIAQPAAICAFLAYISDPLARRPRRFYYIVPAASLFVVIAIAAFVFREGVVCIVMLSPLWAASGALGVEIAYRLRRRKEDVSATFLSPAMLTAPLIVLALEAALPVPSTSYTVKRSTIIEAPASTIWPMMEGIGRVAPYEGKWNFTQSVLDVPRPLAAVLHGKGRGAVREGHWQRAVTFREIVTEWEPNRKIGWRFDFGGSDGWEFVDRHLRPDSGYMRIDRGGYELVPLGNRRYRLELTTSYTARTHFNAYAALWGELFLGDVEDNILAVIKARAESR